jgi:L-threonylcarbamoyladenylate synthase
MAETGSNLDQAAALLMSGRLVAIPTETVYGLAANALNETAVLNIFKAKERPFFDPLIIHVHSLEAAGKYAVFHDARLEALARAFWPGPLTLLLPKKDLIPAIVTSGLAQVAVRVPRHPLCLELLKKTDLPLAAPSANPFGYVSPTEPAHVERQLGGRIDYILDGGPASVGIESTIVGVEDGQVCVFRLGGLAVEELEKICGPVTLRINHSSDPKAPGQLKNHYAPRKPLFTGQRDTLLKAHASRKIALIGFGPGLPEPQAALLVFNLSETGDLTEAALNLFRFLRQADESEAEVVICELLPEQGLGRAINDRLKRAAVKA